MKRCPKCQVDKPSTEFAKCKGAKDGRYYYCKPCHAAYRKANRRPSSAISEEEREARRKQARQWHKANREKVAAKKKRDREKHRERINRYQRIYGAKKRARKRHAMPAWADQEHIKRFYAEAEIMTHLTGVPHEVDHIVPLNGRGVCGLHVPANLRVVTREFNLKKGNKLTLV